VHKSCTSGCIKETEINIIHVKNHSTNWSLSWCYHSDCKTR